MATTSGDSSDQVRNWLELPPDVITMILLKLGAIEILVSAQKVCTLWWNLCKAPLMWRSIDMCNLGDNWNMPYDLEKMTMHAIDRSCGGLVDISLWDFATDELLKYITYRTSNLKHLRLICCNDITDEGLQEAAKGLPFLEDLEISYSSLTDEAIEAVGRCCPYLKSFRFNITGYRRPRTESDEKALAIAKNMPELRHLQLFGNKLTNDGLKAILDNCPHLESIDLRQCFNINLEGSFGKLCAERIKNLRRPLDPTDDYGFDATIQDAESFDEDYASGGSDSDNFSFDHDVYNSFSGCSSPGYDDTGPFSSEFQFWSEVHKLLEDD